MISYIFYCLMLLKHNYKTSKKIYTKCITHQPSPYPQHNLWFWTKPPPWHFPWPKCLWPKCLGRNVLGWNFLGWNVLHSLSPKIYIVDIFMPNESHNLFQPLLCMLIPYISYFEKCRSWSAGFWEACWSGATVFSTLLVNWNLGFILGRSLLHTNIQQKRV